MSVRFVRAMAAVSLLALLSAPDPSRADEKEETAKALKQFEGTWEVESITIDGNLMPKKVEPLVFKGENFNWPVFNKTHAGTLKLDTTKKPTWIDFVVTDGKDKGQTKIAIIKVEGDKLTLATAQKDFGKDRPKEFKSEAGSEVIVWVYKRKK